MQKTQNRYFKHKYSNSIIVSKSDNSSGNYHLYIKLVDGEKIFGMDGNKQFMLATSLRQDSWTELLEEWTKENLYEEYNPFLMTNDEATKFILKCRKEVKENPTYRLGQSIINNLGKKTPTPNIEIFNSLDENFVMDWFYTNCVKI